MCIDFPTLKKLLKKQGITIERGGKRAACSLGKNKITIPSSYFEKGGDVLAVLSILHEVEHCKRTTFDVRALVGNNKKKIFLFNVIEDIRIDQPMLERYKLSKLHKETFGKMIGGRDLPKRYPLYKKIGVCLLADVMLGVKLTNEKETYKKIEEQNLKVHVRNLVGLFSHLERYPVKDSYVAALAYFNWFLSKI
jgi:hypothetical protein